jgi:hypothetical protein
MMRWCHPCRENIYFDLPHDIGRQIIDQPFGTSTFFCSKMTSPDSP